MQPVSRNGMSAIQPRSSKERGHPRRSAPEIERQLGPQRDLPASRIRTVKLPGGEIWRRVDAECGRRRSPSPARAIAYRKGPQTAANRTAGSNPDRRLHEFKDLVAEGGGFEPPIRLITV